MKRSFRLRFEKGFTLIEILVVIGIIAILASIVIIAINPAKQFAQARNTQRQSNVEAILSAIGQRMADNKGLFGGAVGTIVCQSLPTSTARIYDGSVPGTFPAGVTAGVDLSCLVPTYIAAFPTDPDTSFAAAPNTGYDVNVNTTGRVTVCAPQAATETAIPGVSPICITR